MVEKYHHFSLPSFFLNPKHRPSLGTPMNPWASSCQWVRGVPEFLVGPIFTWWWFEPLWKNMTQLGWWHSIPNCFWKVIQNSMVPVTTKKQWRFSWEIYKLWISHEHVWILSASLWETNAGCWFCKSRPESDLLRLFNGPWDVLRASGPSRGLNKKVSTVLGGAVPAKLGDVDMTIFTRAPYLNLWCHTLIVFYRLITPTTHPSTKC